MKRSLLLMTILLLSISMVASFSLAGCKTTTSSETAAAETTATATTAAATTAAATTATAKPFTAAFVNINDIYPYMIRVRDAIVKYGTAEGMKVLVADGAGDLNKQNGEIETFILQKVNVVICNPVDETGGALEANACWKAGIPYIAHNRTLKGVTPEIHVGSLSTEAGKMQADYLAQVLPQNAKVLYLTMDPTFQETIDRKAGLMTLLDKRPDIKILSEQNSQARKDLGMNITETWIQAYQQFDAIVAQNDDAALGAIEALKAANRLKGVIIVGLDGSEPALAAIEAGEMGASLLQDADAQGKAFIDICKQIRDGVDPSTIKSIDVPFQLITKDNVKTFETTQ